MYYDEESTGAFSMSTGKTKYASSPHTLVRCDIEVYGRDSTGRELERRQLHDTWGGRPRVFVVSQCWVLAMWAWSQFPACTGTTHQEPALIDTVRDNHEAPSTCTGIVT